MDTERPSVIDPAQLSRIEATHRGFLYQHLYVTRTLLLSVGTDVSAVVVEGDEDLEILRPAKRVYIQVKHRAGVLAWSDIKGAVSRFEDYRASHAAGKRSGGAEFVIASSAPPSPSLLERLQSRGWPKDVRIEWPGRADMFDPATPMPKTNVQEMADTCREIAGRLPFAVLTPDTLVWKLAGQVTLAAAGQEPRTDHAFRADELPDLFEQLMVQLQAFPAPLPDYRAQEDEPNLLDDSPIRLITGYSGAGKTSWAAQAAVHAAGEVAYFDVRDVPGGGLSAGLARELAARRRKEGGGLGHVLLPGASGIEILQYLSRDSIESSQPLTVVLDNIHEPPPADVEALVRAASGFRFVMLGQPGPNSQELMARLRIQGEALNGWSSDSVAAEAATHGCRADAATCQSLLEQTGGLPLYVQNAVTIAVSEHGGSLADLCRDLEAQAHSVETAQELILARVIDALPVTTAEVVAVLSLSDIPLGRKEVAAFIREALKLEESKLAAHLRGMRTTGVIEIFGGDKTKVHDAIRLIGRARLVEMGEQAASAARHALKAMLSQSLKTGWEYKKLVLYIRMLAEIGDTKTLVELGRDEVFHEMGIWPVIEPYLFRASTSNELNPDERFWALDGIVFNNMRIGKEEGTADSIALMNQLVEEHGLGDEAQLAVGMKEMTVLALAGDVAGAKRLMKTVADRLENTPAHKRIFRYNAAASMFFLGEYNYAEREAYALIEEYYDLLGLTPQIVMGRNPPELHPLLKKSHDLDDNLKHLADTLELYAKVRAAQKKVSGLARIHAMKFYSMSNSLESVFRVGQDLVDDFVAHNDYIGAREIFETNLLPNLQVLKLASYIIPIRSQYAVVLAYCGDIQSAEAEMTRLSPYEAGLDPVGQEELRRQRQLIGEIKRYGPPPQRQLPSNQPKSVEEFRQNMVVKKVGRNERCPCGSGVKYKKCHGF
ncbi:MULTISPECIES: SEC-C metal-binding domain-containing protein [unclassified Halomonas]|uniref:SEC-C metal-binding domain-containing protein n=1 Tax=unclassified Halomonas TaxID=2609666 RepID=UPI0018D21DE7|nr:MULTISPECIES: SEC-C metal-binding domain-containing protein [unclassified Halomonas]QPP50492.1 SEC-C domain-containing protein [Halomonas sp. SS10-MC5]